MSTIVDQINTRQSSFDSDREGRRRVVIENVGPAVDGGLFPAKRTVGDDVIVTADIFTDGHDAITTVLRWRHEQDDQWIETPLEFVENDQWRGSFRVSRLGRYVFSITAWIDHFKSWRRDLEKRIAAGQNVALDLRIGAGLIGEAARRDSAERGKQLALWARALEQSDGDPEARIDLALSDQLAAVVAQAPDRRLATIFEPARTIVVDPQIARFSSWYEMFPRSCSAEIGRPGTLRDCEERLSYVAGLGFNVVYLPPIHPIGKTERKGKNNATTASPNDPGSPWAIGSADGGHKAIHSGLGTIDDFRRFVDRARQYGIDVALDIAFQCSPDHPWVTEHPEWFHWRPDRTVQYAENPPKKYQDIYPLNFECDEWQSLWNALEDIFRYWLAQGVRIFRVDNPHTKPFPFWAWVIDRIKATDPDVIFLAEAFTRPKMLARLAKLGFSQSYTYFAWRNTKAEITDYFTELIQSSLREYLRPNLWPNTPDILTEYLQFGERPAFAARVVLAATLGASYGIYGPAFELIDHAAVRPGSEEYLDSEKYEIKHWNLSQSNSLQKIIGRLNQIRRDNSALQRNDQLLFHPTTSEDLICYSKSSDDQSNVILTVVNLNPYHRKNGWVDLDLTALGLDSHQPYQVHDLLSDARYLWSGSRNYVELDPQQMPAHVFRLRRRIRTEHDFEYFL